MINEMAISPEDPGIEGVEPAEGGADSLLRLKQIVMVLAAFNVGLLGAGTYMYATREPVVQPQYVAPLSEEPQQDLAEPAEQEAGAAAPAPAVSSGGGAWIAPAASRPAAAIYRRRGDISDIFCQPWADETEAEWRARVAEYCEK